MKPGMAEHGVALPSHSINGLLSSGWKAFTFSLAWSELRSLVTFVVCPLEFYFFVFLEIPGFFSFYS